MRGRPGARALLLAPIAFAAAAVLGTGGCGAPAEMPPPEPPMQVALGGAAVDGSGFVALAGDVSLIPGSQGGFHVWTKYRVTGPTAAESVHVAFKIRRISDQRLILTAQRQQEIGPTGEAGYWELPAAMPAFMCPSPLGVQVQDLPMRLELEISETEGSPLLGAAQAEFTPHCPAGDQAEFCVRVCSG